MARRRAREAERVARELRSGQPHRHGRHPRRWLPAVDETCAGGLVIEPGARRGLLIGRLDRRGRLGWSLPKGHIEAGETAEQAASREVAEETGIATTTRGRLGELDFWFVADDRRVHKTVNHFVLVPQGGELSTADHEVCDVAWFPLHELPDRLAYSSERDLIRQTMSALTSRSERA